MSSAVAIAEDFFNIKYPKEFGGYNNNPNLRRENKTVHYTEAMLHERIKCAKDPVYFMERYMKIITLDKGFVTIKLFDFQKELLKSFIDNRYTIAKLPRQVGKTTVTVGYILWYICFHNDKNIAILANKASTARDILQKITLSYESLPMWLQQGVRSWNKGSIELENNCKVVAGSTSGSTGRSGAFNLVFLDEFAFVPRNVASDFMTSVYPTISSGKKSKIIMVSTPNGMNLFYKFWNDAMEKRNLYVPITAHWSCVPGRDEKWRLEQIAQMGEEKFNQEFNTEFLGSSDTLISPTRLADLTWKDPKDNKFLNITNLSLFEEKVPEHQYVVIVDTSRGKNIDYSAFRVVDVSEMPYRSVAVFRDNKILALSYARVVSQVAKYFNDAYILVESNDIGSQINDLLFYDLEYENIISTKQSAKKNSQQAVLGYSKDSKFGVTTSKKVKNIGCMNIKTLIEDKKIIVEDFETISEFTSFVSSGTSFQAESGCHDDLVMTLVLFAWLTTQSVFANLTDGNLLGSYEGFAEQTQRNAEKKMEALKTCLPSLAQNSTGEGRQVDFDNSAVWLSDGADFFNSSSGYFKKR